MRPEPMRFPTAGQGDAGSGDEIAPCLVRRPSCRLSRRHSDFFFIRYTVLISANEDETAVHGCNLAISVLVLLVSHKVYFFHVV